LSGLSVHPNPAVEIENFQDLKKNCKKYFKNYIIYDFGEEII
jgi:hypothetical protein